MKKLLSLIVLTISLPCLGMHPSTGFPLRSTSFAGLDAGQISDLPLSPYEPYLSVQTTDGAITKIYRHQILNLGHNNVFERWVNEHGYCQAFEDKATMLMLSDVTAQTLEHLLCINARADDEVEHYLSTLDGQAIIDIHMACHYRVSCFRASRKERLISMAAITPLAHQLGTRNDPTSVSGLYTSLSTRALDQEYDRAAGVCGPWCEIGTITAGRNYTPRADDQMAAIPSAFSTTARVVAVSPNGALLAAGSQHGSVRLIDLRTSREVQYMTVGSDTIKHLSFDADGTRLFVGTDDHSAKIFMPAQTHQFVDLPPEKKLLVIKLAHQRPISAEELTQLQPMISALPDGLRTWAEQQLSE